MKLFKYIITLLFLTSLTFLYSKDYRMQYIDATAGLPQADVKSIAQDNNGFLWISTNDGLARYDGYEFKNYSVIKEGIPTSLTRTLKCDALGNLWIGTLDRGLFVYDSSLERFDNISQKLPQDVNNKHLFIYDIAINKIDNSIWITQEFGLVYRIEYSGEGDKRQYQIKHYAIPELDKQRTNSSSLMVDSLGRTIIVKTNKAYIYNQHNDSFEALLPKTINHIAQLKIGGDRLYYIKYGRLHSSLFDGTEARLESTLAIKYFLRGDNGVLWLFTNDGIYYKSSTESEHHKISDTAHVVLCSKEDSQGNMWVGLLRKGLLAIMDDKAPFMHYAENQSAETIFENTQKDIIVGSIGGELNLLTPDTLGRYSCHNIDIKQSNQNIFAIGENHLRDEYIVCRSGIAYAIKRDDIIANNTSTAPHTKIESAESIRSITFDSTYVWLGSYAHGLMLYDAQEYKLISCFTDVSPQLKLPSNIVRNTLLDRDNNLWVATSKGLVRIAAEQRFSDSPQYKIYQHDKDDPSSISYDYIIPIAQDTKGRIWIGTLGGGVNCLTFDRDDKIIENVIYTTQNGLSNNSIKGIVIDNQDMVWVTTNRGVNRIDPQTKKVKLYTPRHGLQSYEFSELSAIKLSDGRIALGGVNGLNIFDPQDIVENNQPTPITITSFTLLNKPIKPGELFYGEEILQHTIAQSHELELKYKFNSFAFEFLSINLTNPQSVKYSYMLEGFDHQWNTTPWNNRIARYTNIPPGEYTFKVRSQNSDGEWSQSAEIKIRVQYPPLLSPIAFIVYALLLIASIFLVIWEIRRRQREKTKIILMQQEKQQLRELSQMKLNFFTNISHEFRTPLTLIITPLQLLRSGANIGKEKRDRYLDVIAYNSNILYNLITEFLNMAKSDKDNFDINLRQIDVVALTKRAFMQFETWTQQQSITADLDLPSKVIMAMADPIKLEEIIYNLLSNAIKYTPTNGRIHLSLHEESDNFISVSISNSGE
ncbi:MAG: two-component regulator propeller domain-containing protein, partial [Rikenellaceae bacterium]